MSRLIRAGIAAAAIIASTFAASPSAERFTYFLINGPDFREVTRAQFDDERSSCMRIDIKHYPEDHLVEYHCYL